ncbi:MAG TPA: glycosyltransferase family 39 protein, partial [Tepidisphaeraceae bacterium]|nr:glycosyltransferase family 39 protein [Tepidisphaeraceae bacterium]
GSGGIPILLCWFSFAGFVPSFGMIAALLGAAIISIIVLAKFHRVPTIARPLTPKISRWEFFVLALAAIMIGLQLSAALAAISMPMYSVDAVAIWGLKAKVVAAQPLLPRPDYFTDLSLNYSHLDYPLLVPFLLAGSYSAIGAVNDAWGKIVLLVPLIAMIALLYSAVRDELGRARSAILTAVAIAAPAVAFWAGRGGADVTLTGFIFAASWSIMRWVRDQQTGDAMTAGLFTAMAAFTKLEGGVLIVSTIAVATIAMLTMARKNRQWVWGWIGFILSLGTALGPWLLWSRGLPHTHENYGARLTLANLWEHRGRFPDLALTFASELKNWSYLGGVLLIAAAALIGWRGWGKPFILAGWAIVVAQMLAYVAVFLVTPWDPHALILITASRLSLHVFPLAILLAGLHWGCIRNEFEN